MRDGKNENKTSYKKIIMMFLISKPSPNCLFSSHQTIDGQWDCAYLQLKLLQCWQLNVYAEQNNGAVPFLSPELAIFSTGHEEYVRELCTRCDLHVKFVLFAGLKCLGGVRSLHWVTVGLLITAESLLAALILAPFVSSSFFWFTEEIADAQESFMAAISLRLRVFSTLEISPPMTLRL